MQTLSHPDREGKLHSLAKYRLASTWHMQNVNLRKMTMAEGHYRAIWKLPGITKDYPGSQCGSKFTGKDGKCPSRVHISYTSLWAQHVSSVNTHVTVASALIHTCGKPVVSFPPSILAVGRLQPFDQADFVRYMTELCCAKHPWGSWHLCTLKEKKRKVNPNCFLLPFWLREW